MTGRKFKESEIVELYNPQGDYIGKWKVIYVFEYLQRVSLQSTHTPTVVIGLPIMAFYNELTEQYICGDYFYVLK